MKIYWTQTGYYSQYIRQKTFNYINIMIFYLLIQKIEEYNMKKIKKKKKAIRKI